MDGLLMVGIAGVFGFRRAVLYLVWTLWSKPARLPVASSFLRFAHFFRKSGRGAILGFQVVPCLLVLFDISAVDDLECLDTTAPQAHS